MMFLLRSLPQCFYTLGVRYGNLYSIFRVFFLLYKCLLSVLRVVSVLISPFGPSSLTSLNGTLLTPLSFSDKLLYESRECKLKV